MSEDAGTASAARELNAERTKAFVDAVVAIAMTLLILPLMDSVNDSAARNHTTAEWLVAERDQLQSFLRHVPHRRRPTRHEPDAALRDAASRQLLRAAWGGVRAARTAG